MKNKLKVLIVGLIATMGIFGIANTMQFVWATTPVVSAPSAPQMQYYTVSPLELVSNPYKFINRNIRIYAKFDKFSTLGLDYPQAMRSHDKYISFMIQRPDITNHNIPLSELKIFLKKEVAEKNIDLDAGDDIEFTGKVFSTALGDPWVDVHDFRVVRKVKKTDKK